MTLEMTGCQNSLPRTPLQALVASLSHSNQTTSPLPPPLVSASEKGRKILNEPADGPTQHGMENSAIKEGTPYTQSHNLRYALEGDSVGEEGRSSNTF